MFWIPLDQQAKKSGKYNVNLHFSSAFYCGVEGTPLTALHLVGLLNVPCSTFARASAVLLVSAAPPAPRGES
jgi:hypothetical protein